jgi:hypothetical protein
MRNRGLPLFLLLGACAAPPDRDAVAPREVALRALVDLPEGARAEIGRVALPVLLPARPALFGRVVVTHGAGWYAASLHGDGLDVSIHGLAVSHAAPEIADEQRAAGFGSGAPRLEIVDGIVSASFERDGLGYTLDVECAQGPSDARCADDRFTRDLVAELVKVRP